MLSKITDCGKFCGAFELTLPGHDKTLQTSKVFRMSCWRLDNKLLSVTTTHFHGLKKIFFIFRQMRKLTFLPEFSSTLRFSRHFEVFKRFFFSLSLFGPPLIPVATALLERMTANLCQKRE